MRYIVYGIGAIGGTVAARLALSGANVLGIARGPQYDAIAADGLLLRTPMGNQRARFPVVPDPAAIAFLPDDIIVLTLKSQHTRAALEALAAAGVSEQAIVCAQNGIDNERQALRVFPNVYGLLVLMPAVFSTPGIVDAFGTPHHGIFDIGRYPGGDDETARAIAADLTRAGIAAQARPDVMTAKNGKLLVNLANIVGAALGEGHEAIPPIARRLTAEGEAVFAAAGLAHEDVGSNAARRARLMTEGEIAGAERVGSSSTQSLSRGTGSIETDWLNGEIALLGRLHGVPTPANAYFAALARRMLAEGLQPGSIGLAEIEAALG
ncbi:ketopantoate reductase family protein [Arsenicitalea aurantiaca]|uniref:2-dehydropantoate 2-reductase n=1 Tax=Arsenicitalea aurantiaca TaxID=1783274 RepID=A0A433X809_9HYPH|nr:2-dehydropantoate 2-reductase N-terminal domain-containing protein [Arsenicitalea aurantiaca]RUT30206.1 ketopantoate reductase family protein [Arsenicitalea aurantiaca]